MSHTFVNNTVISKAFLVAASWQTPLPDLCGAADCSGSDEIISGVFESR
jgi:hypothetical protein